jgi:adenylate cyclase
MAEERVHRRLAAILAADVVGYSRLLEQDEAGTLAALKQRRKGILQPLVAEHHGRIVKVMGDGVLVEFASAVNAVACAAKLQRRMAAANDGVAEDRRILLRIGINLGDVVVEGGDLYGDGVIIAVRLQAMAEPGGICVSGSVHEQVGGKLPLAFDDLGPCDVKNIARPVRVFRAQIDPQRSERAVTQQPISAKPSIAVLPFTNMSGDPEQEYFSDGISEDIITDLSQVSALFVVARNTAFTFKGKAVEVVEAARKLNVGYILEGSVRKAGNRIRITVQLIDGATGGPLWAERYDRDFGDIFALQDDISKSVVSALRVRLLPEELKTITARSTTSAEAYRYYLQARSTYYLSWGNTPELWSARKLFAEAVAIDPGYARAYAGIADCDAFLWVHGDLLRSDARQQQQSIGISAESCRSACIQGSGAIPNWPLRGSKFGVRACNRIGSGVVRAVFFLCLQLQGDGPIRKGRGSLRAGGRTVTKRPPLTEHSCGRVQRTRAPGRE